MVKLTLTVLLSDSDDMSSEDEINDDEKCCVCNLFTPTEARQSFSLIFTKRIKCDYCTHWVHLKYCSKQSVIRRGYTLETHFIVTEYAYLIPEKMLSFHFLLYGLC